MVKQKGLGRGLDALLANDVEDARNTDSQQMLNVSQLQPGKYQPRSYMDAAALQTLADSIQSQGIMQPILVREISTDIKKIGTRLRFFTLKFHFFRFVFVIK